MITTKRPPAQN